MKLWGGRFAQQTRDPDFERFSESFSVDQRLILYDLQANQAYVKALGAAGVFSKSEVDRLVRGLQSISRRVRADPLWSKSKSAEDVHTWVEARLEKEVGALARKLRTGRSRNDLVATETRLYSKSAIQQLRSAIVGLLEALLHQARRYCGVVMPGYTHLQPAQPVLLSHYLLAYYEMLARDFERLESCRDRLDELPLGAGALAGAAFPIDRAALARDLGFSRVTRNSIDATSDRDFVCELVFCCALTMAHLSRLAEDFIVYSSPAFNYLEIPEAYSTGSSIMPQKRNPDSLELIRGKSATVLGKLSGILALLKGLPLAYNRDLQEDKIALFEAVDTTRDSLQLASRIIAGLKIIPERMKTGTQLGFLTATEIADELVRRGLSFREAHDQVGKLVSYCANGARGANASRSYRPPATETGVGASRERSFADLSDVEARRFIPLWDSELRRIAISPEDAAQRRDVTGGTAPGQVERQLKAAQRRLAQFRRTVRDGVASLNRDNQQRPSTVNATVRHL